MNTAYGEPSGEALPFDLRASRWPMQYHLPDDATPEAKTEVKRRLTRELTAAIRACLQTLGDSPARPRRVPLTDLRAWAIEAGWNGDVQAATVGDNDWWSFAKQLRQAAADGAIAFAGRRYLYDFGKDTDSEPLIAVLRAHFDEFGFDVIQLAQADNYDIFTGKLGESPASLKGSIFRDLHVDDVQARAWLETAGNPPAPADMAVRVEAGGAQIGDYKPVCSLAIRNIGKTEFERCFVEMIEFSEVVPHKMPMPFAFRTAAQIRAGAEGRFSLSAGQEVIIPVVFHRQQRANEWFHCCRRHVGLIFRAAFCFQRFAIHPVWSRTRTTGS